MTTWTFIGTTIGSGYRAQIKRRPVQPQSPRFRLEAAATALVEN